MAKKTSTEKHHFWKSHVEAWKQSGLSQSKYCRKNDIGYDQFNYQYNRFHKTEESPQQPLKEEGSAKFITLNVEPTTNPSPTLAQFKVSHVNGSTFEWSAPWDPQEVASFINHWSA